MEEVSIFKENISVFENPPVCLGAQAIIRWPPIKSKALFL